MENKQFKKPFSKKQTSTKTFRRPVAGGYLLYLLAFPFVFKIISSLAGGRFFDFIVASIVFVLMMVGATSIRRGRFIEAQAQARKWKRSNKLPYKTTGAIAFASAICLASFFLADNSLFIAIGFGLSCLLGIVLCYGLDPQYKNDTMSRFGVTNDEIIEALEEAEQKIALIEQASHKIHDMDLKNQLKRITTKAHQILASIEEDPKDLRRSRKFLKVYLDGAQKVTMGYAKMQHERTTAIPLSANFRSVLNTIETTFEQQAEHLKQDDILDLDVQIEVLSAQLKHEGIS